MKLILSFLCSIFICLLAYPQDLIIFKSGQEISVKVLEVGIDEIKYKKGENTPIYIIKKTDVSSIKYSDGSSDLFEKNANQYKLIQQDTIIEKEKNYLREIKKRERNLFQMSKFYSLTYNAMFINNSIIKLINTKYGSSLSICMNEEISFGIGIKAKYSYQVVQYSYDNNDVYHFWINYRKGHMVARIAI